VAIAEIGVRSEVRPAYGAEAAAPPQPTVMAEYRCRKCHRYLFTSDAAYGRLRVTCPGRGCRTEQTVFLGGRQPARMGP
jgi:hypothetical protein